MMNNPLQMLNALRTNPMQILSQRFNIPQNINLNNPNDIIQYLLNSKQVTQDQVNRAMQMRNMFNQK